jgi:hypothetical protein
MFSLALLIPYRTLTLGDAEPGTRGEAVIARSGSGWPDVLLRSPPPSAICLLTGSNDPDIR